MGRVLVLKQVRRFAAQTSTRRNELKTAVKPKSKTAAAQGVARRLTAITFAPCRSFNCFYAFALSRFCLRCPLARLRPSTESRRIVIVFYLPFRTDRVYLRPLYRI